VRKFVAFALIQLGFLAACGGGGGYGGGGGSPPPPPPPVQVIATPGPPNVEPITVDAGPPGLTLTAVNIPYIKLTVCAPGSTTNCQTIDHILVDTQSIGLRILGEVLTITLPPEPDASMNPLAECLAFADGNSWGSVRVADVQFPVSGEKATNANVQVITDKDPAYPLPAACSARAENTVAAFGAKGILGVGPFLSDCSNNTCAPSTTTPFGYYSCPGGTCTTTTVTFLEQLQNPVTLFAADKNGTIIELPAVGTSGATMVSGSLVFGIATQGNNALGSAMVLPADLNQALLTASFNGATYTSTYLDTGSNANIFTDSQSPACATGNTSYDCPASTLNLSATLTATNGATATAAFSVANANNLFNANPTYTAFSNLGAPASDNTVLDLGLPFFYGHNVFTAIEGENTAAGMGPYYAY
jgi:hypothetical protein